MSRKRVKIASPVPLRMVIFGVQGSGKGTQAEMLARGFGLAHISTGEIFRSEISHRTAQGLQASRYLASGKLVPDRITNAIVVKHLRSRRVRRRGFVLDGYPRNRRQLTALTRLGPITHAIEITLPVSVAVHRISGRLSCRCGLCYHITYNPPKRRGVCDRCGRKLFVRDDDRPATIRQRIRIYHRDTAPLISYYRQKNILYRVDGRPSIARVYQQILALLRKSPHGKRL